jgi:hypothetical protein
MPGVAHRDVQQNAPIFLGMNAGEHEKPTRLAKASLRFFTVDGAPVGTLVDAVEHRLFGDLDAKLVTPPHVVVPLLTHFTLKTD